MWDINDIAPESEAVQAEREIFEDLVRTEAEPPSYRVQRDPDGCDECGKVADLYHNDRLGLALCERCDIAADEEAVPVTWKRLRSGGWGVTGPSAVLIEGTDVVVTKRDGTTKIARVGRVLWSGDGRAIATTRR